MVSTFPTPLFTWVQGRCFDVSLELRVVACRIYVCFVSMFALEWWVNCVKHRSLFEVQRGGMKTEVKELWHCSVKWCKLSHYVGFALFQAIMSCSLGQPKIHCVVESDLEQLLSLPPPSYWDYRTMSPVSSRSTREMGVKVFLLAVFVDWFSEVSFCGPG